MLDIGEYMNTFSGRAGQKIFKDDYITEYIQVMFDQPVGWQTILFHQSVDCIFSRQDS